MLNTVISNCKRENIITDSSKLMEIDRGSTDLIEKFRQMPLWKCMNRHAKDKVVNMCCVAERYRQDKDRFDDSCMTGLYESGSAGFASGALYVAHVDNAMNLCTVESRRILRKTFLHPCDLYWYRDYYTQEEFIRKLTQAIEELFRYLGLLRS